MEYYGLIYPEGSDDEARSEGWCAVSKDYTEKELLDGETELRVCYILPRGRTEDEFTVVVDIKERAQEKLDFLLATRFANFRGLSWVGEVLTLDELTALRESVLWQ